jgi:hypothetical protein
MRLRDRLPNYLTEADITDYETESSFIIYRDTNDTVGVNSQTGVLISRNTNSRIVFNAVLAAASAGSLLFIKDGTYTLDATGGATYAFLAGMQMIGAGEGTILNLTGCSLYIHNVDNCRISNLKLMGRYGIRIFEDTDGSSNHTLDHLHITQQDPGDQAGVFVYVNNSSITGIYIDHCFFDTCFLFGLYCSGEGVSRVIKDLHVSHCYVYKCGWGHVWGCGLDICENSDLYDSSVTDTTIEQSWESGIHTEIARTKENVIIANCISKDNGQKAGATYGAGYMVSKGMKVVNCISDTNINGFYCFSTGTYVTELSNCVDYGSTYAFNITGTGTTGKLVGRGCVSYNSTTKSLQVMASKFVDMEFTAIGSLSGASSTLTIGASGGSVVSYSRFNLTVLDPDPTPAIAVYTSYSNNNEFSGYIRCTNLIAFKLSNPTDTIVRDIHIDIDCTNGLAILFSDTVADCTVQNINIENTIAAHVCVTGIQNSGTAGEVVVLRQTCHIKDVTNPYMTVVFKSNWGSSTGTGAQQTVAHLLSATPTCIMLGDKELNAIPYQSAAADAANIYVTAAVNQDWTWYVAVD